ncbi:hypothetical protein HY379_02450 [Candidatus Saccharibacteria bacterium]|nr:hypothetical protein [Candidatus Saccharibacteria bacterium]
MFSERGYTPFISEKGVQDRLPKGQTSIDELMAEIQEEMDRAEKAKNQAKQIIGTVALAEKQPEQTAG